MHDTKIEMKLEEETKKLSEICERLVDSAKQQIDSGIQNVDTEEFGQVIDAIKDLCDAKEKIAKKCYYESILKAMEKAEEEDKEQEKYMIQMLKEEYGDDEGKRFYDNWRYSNGRFAPAGRGSYRPRSYGRSRRGYDDMGYMMMPEMYDREMMRDMDRENGKMYYSGSGNSGNSSGGNSGSNSGGSYGGNSGGRSGGNSGNSSRGYSDGYNAGEESGYQRGYSEGNRDGRRSGNRSSSRYDSARRGYEESKSMHQSNSQEDNEENMKSLKKFLSVVDEDLKELEPDMTPSEKTMLKTTFNKWGQRM